ncbi:MAG: metallophosphoesterase [Clostridia bacterium]|nr:metallophosphoesterase [Clostridia bacterium]
MKANKASRILALLLAAGSLFMTACGGGNDGSSFGNSSHTHAFTEKNVAEEYLKSEPDCENAARYYYSCECGEKGEESFAEGKQLWHSYTEKVMADEYFKAPANCQRGAEYYLSCVRCGKKGLDYHVFYDDELGDCVYNQEVAEPQYIKTEPTLEKNTEYYKSCVCGAKGNGETFWAGEPLTPIPDADKPQYKATSLTVTMYDSKQSVYGFTYNTDEKPLRAVIQIKKGDTLSGSWEEYTLISKQYKTYDENDQQLAYWVSKVDIKLDASSTYTYRAYDKYAEIGTETTGIQTKDPNATKFTFTHVSDSQVDTASDGSGAYYKQVLSNIVGATDFAVHTGDMTNNPKYEWQWDNMVDSNFSYLSKLPVMPVSGNHEQMAWYGGENEMFEHFHNKFPEQTTTTGYYFSFEYGNAKFLLLNTNTNGSGGLDGAQYEWLVNELKNNTCTWTFVAMHCPMYSAGQWGIRPDRKPQSMALRNQLSKLFAQYGVDVVLQGHDHLISRTLPINEDCETTTETWETVNGIEYSVNPDGVLYLMNGPAGNQTRSPYSMEEGALYKYVLSSNVSSWADFEIDGNTLTVTAKYATESGVQQYRKWGIKKTA